MTDPVVAADIDPIPRPVPAADHSVLVVDDSPVVRRLITEVLQSEPGFNVVGQAVDGVEAVEMVRRMQPDSMVLDLRMPTMDGWEVLAALADLDPRPRVVVFANVTPADLGATTQKVRSLGAELVVKPTGVADALQARSRIRQTLVSRLAQPSIRGRIRERRRANQGCDAVVIASSTGGPQALEAVLGGIRQLPVPAFMVQHISTGFSERLAHQLDHSCRFGVVEASDGMQPAAGQVYLSPGGRHLRVERSGARPVLRLDDSPPVNSCRPSADVLFESAAEVYRNRVLGVVLTGIGEDGLAGCRALAAHGATILVQDEPTSVVWGMPGAVAGAGLADEIVPLERLGARIERLVTADSGQAGDVRP
jgi:two-component system chemotaxis response regulator CheB